MIERKRRKEAEKELLHFEGNAEQEKEEIYERVKVHAAFSRMAIHNLMRDTKIQLG